MTGRHFPVSLGRPKKTGQPTTTLFIKLSDTSQVALVANQAQTLAHVRQYVVKNISPRKAKFTLHVPDSELLLSPGFRDGPHDAQGRGLAQPSDHSHAAAPQEQGTVSGGDGGLCTDTRRNTLKRVPETERVVDSVWY